MKQCYHEEEKNINEDLTYFSAYYGTDFINDQTFSKEIGGFSFWDLSQLTEQRCPTIE